MSGRRSILIFVAGLAGAGLAGQQREMQRRPDKRKLVPGDVIRVVVWKDPDLTSPLRVGGDGYIEQPLAGRVRAAGLTMAQLARKLEAALAPFIARPQVRIVLVRAAPQRTAAAPAR